MMNEGQRLLGLVLLCATFAFTVTITVVVWSTDLIKIALNEIIRYVFFQNMGIENNTAGYDIWSNPPIYPIVQVYLFNYTNADAFAKGIDKKLRVQEVGPYVYREYTEKVNIVFHDNGTVSYQGKSSFSFVPELSVGHQPRHERVIMPNIPLLVSVAIFIMKRISTYECFEYLSAIFYSLFPPLSVKDVGASMSALSVMKDNFLLAQIAFLAVARGLEAEQFVRVTAHDFMWGYDDPLFSAAATMGHAMPYKKFGILARLRWAEYVARMGESRNAYRVLVGRTEGKRPLGRPRRRWENNIEMDLREVGYDGRDWANLAQDRDRWRAYVRVAMNLRQVSGRYREYYCMELQRVGVRKDTVTMYTGKRNLQKLGMVTRFNGQERLRHWSGECNRIDGTDGTMFPPNLLDRNTTIYIFQGNMCRRLPLQYTEDAVILGGIPVLRYRVPRNTFDNPDVNPENACFCHQDVESCLPSGLFNASPCTFGAPVVMSFPHFYLGDPALQEIVDGLNPDPEKHDGYIDIHQASNSRISLPENFVQSMQRKLVFIEACHSEPADYGLTCKILIFIFLQELGVSLGGRSRLQFNMMVRKPSALNQLADFADGSVLPIAWFDTSVEDLPKEILSVVYHVTFTTRRVEKIMQYVLLAVSCALLYVLVRRFRNSRSPASNSDAGIVAPI
ncbi:hypothetical protein ANN_06418 [Periplaneta americana]|uniref:Scavenger receptor class B member 1 n=1 Tax=Periplaneta americana TaxID=6978 RepID=A0ABQ8TFA5_PERAM|nr:hypothetical protein ANN_06418 [Periplaneta americana]